jgi:hypothetical protein
MAYEVNFTDGTVAAVVEDGIIDTAYSVSLVGKNVTTYGEVFAENFIKLLENGSNNTAPTNPVKGELWFNSSSGTVGNIGPLALGVYDGSTFAPLGGAFADASAPSGPNVGDLWFDTVNDQLKVYSGAGFIVIGPGFKEPDGVSGAIAETVTDNLSVDHLVVKVYVSKPGNPGGTASEVIAIISQDPVFTVNTASPITGFTTISPGIQLTSAGAIGAQFHGEATNSQRLDNINSTQFVRNDQLLETVLELAISGDLDVNGDTTVADFAIDASSTVDMGANRVQNVDTPTASTDAANKAFVDAVSTGSTSGLALKLDLVGGTMSGAIDMGSNLITSVTNPVSAQDASTKQYVDTAETDAVATSNTYADGLITTLKGTATTSFDTLGEIETEIGNLSTSSTAGLALKVAKAGDTMTGSLVLNADPSVSMGAATKQYVDVIGASGTGALDIGLALKVAKSGDSMTGTLVLNANPINALEAATKQYVDAEDSAAVANASADASAKVALVVGTASAGYDTLGEIETEISNLSTTTTASLALKFNKAGGTVSGAIDMGSNRVTSLATPTASTDAATKAYVDNITPSATSNGYGTRTVSSSAPTGGSSGDIHYQI